MAKKNKVKTVYDLKEEMVEEVQELREVVVPAPAAPAPTKPASFKSLREAKAYAKANGGKVVEKGKFYVR